MNNTLRSSVITLLLAGSMGCGAQPNDAESPATAARETSEKSRVEQASAGNASSENASTGPKRSSGSCEQVASAWEKEPEPDSEKLLSLADGFADCGDYAFLFEHVVHYGNDKEGEQVLVELAKGGKPVEAELLKYLGSHKGPKFFEEQEGRPNDIVYGLRHITGWLTKKGGPHYCSLFAAAAKGANATARRAVLTYLTEAKCKEGIPVAVETLLDDSPGNRAYSCQYLGAFGDASVLEKVKTLAETDGYSDVREEEREDGSIYGVKIYPVRDACTAAYGKIKLRS